MRVLYFTRDYTPHDHRFLSALAHSEHQVYSLRLERRGAGLESRPLPEGIHPIEWAGGQRPAQRTDGPRLWWDLKRVIARVQPDLIHAGPIPTVGLLAALSGFQPLVSMSWGSDLLVDADRSPAWRWAARYALRRSAVLVGDCKAVRDKAISLGFPPQRIVTFPWGVDLNTFYPGEDGGLRAQLGWQQNFGLLSLRSWEPLYGVDVIARAFVLAAQQNPEIRLLLLGSGSQSAPLRQLLAEGGVLDRVHFGGQVAQSELPRYYRAADLYLSASHSDGSSVSLLEALASGLPALVSDIAGNREWIEPGVQGWLFPDGDAASLAEAILRAARAPERLQRMRPPARALAERRANWDLNFQELLKGYELAVRGMGRNRPQLSYRPDR